MRSFILATALVAHALTALGALHRHSHGHVQHPAQHKRSEQELDEAAKLRKRDMYEFNKRAAEEKRSTNWGDGSDDEFHEGYISVATWYHGAVKYIHYSKSELWNVTWNPEIAKCAQEIASRCVYEHDLSCCPECGQNIAAGNDAGAISETIAELWYNSEVSLYGNLYGSPSLSPEDFEQTGHFTQMAWKSTSEIGCATVACDILEGTGGGVRPYLTVCNYLEAGNMDGMFDTMVHPPRTDWTIDGKSYPLV